MRFRDPPGRPRCRSPTCARSRCCRCLDLAAFLKAADMATARPGATPPRADRRSHRAEGRGLRGVCPYVTPSRRETSSRRRNVITSSPWRQRRLSRALLPPSVRAVCAPRVSAARTAGLGLTSFRGSVVDAYAKTRPSPRLAAGSPSHHRAEAVPAPVVRLPRYEGPAAPCLWGTELQEWGSRHRHTELPHLPPALGSPHSAPTALLPLPRCGAAPYRCAHRPRPGPTHRPSAALRPGPGGAALSAEEQSRAVPSAARRRGEQRDGEQVGLGGGGSPGGAARFGPSAPGTAVGGRASVRGLHRPNGSPLGSTRGFCSLKAQMKSFRRVPLPGCRDA